VSKGEGKTVVFVSHDMGMVEKLCDAGIVLSSGRNQTFSTIEKAILKYLLLVKNKIFPISFNGNLARKLNVYNITINGINIDQFELDSIIPNQENVIDFYFETTEIFYFKVFFAVYVNGLRIFTLVDSKSFSLAGSKFNSKFVIPKNLLRPNLYTIGIGITDNFNNWSWSRDTFSFEISKSWINEENKDNFGIVNIDSKSSRYIII
jgi:lipopolysaccharide transport system ATP-binding protein